MIAALSPQTPTALLTGRAYAGPGLAGAQDQLKDAVKTRDEKKIDQAARDFEAVFVGEMLKPMFEGLDPDPLFGGGKGEEIFQGLMIQEYGKSIAAGGGFGLAQAIKAEMVRLQEAADHPSGEQQTGGQK